jgi:integrase
MKSTQEVVTSFMADGKLRGLSPKTLEDRQRHYNQLIQISPRFPPKPEIVQDFLANVKGGAYNRDSYWRDFHALGAYGERRYKIPNFMKSVTRPRIPKEIMPTISELDLNLLASFLENAPPRDKAIMALFIDTAVRKGEAANLKRQDILEDRIIVHGKTGYRVVPISNVTRDLILSLPAHEDGFVFHGTGRYKDYPLASTGFYKIVKKYLRKIGYQGKQCGPQVLRRSFGRFWLKYARDMRSLQLILGHANIETTARHYAPYQEQDVIEIHQKHTPGRIFANDAR